MLYEDINDAQGVALLTFSERPRLSLSHAAGFLRRPPFATLAPKPEYTMMGRTYALGNEDNLERMLIDRPRQKVCDPSMPWAIWYPLRRAGTFEQLPAAEQRVILMEHGGIGHAYGRAGYGYGYSPGLPRAGQERQRFCGGPAWPGAVSALVDCAAHAQDQADVAAPGAVGAVLFGMRQTWAAVRSEQKQSEGVKGMSTAVLLLAYGGPDSLADVPAYLLDIRGGRETPQALVDEITHRYAEIGGYSPLLRITRSAAAQLQAVVGLPVYVGMRHWQPWIKDAVAQMVHDGVTRGRDLHGAALQLAEHRRLSQAI